LDIDLSLDAPDPGRAGEPSPPSTGEGGGRSQPGEEAECLEALYRLLIEKEQRLIAMLKELEVRLDGQAERDKRLAAMLAPTTEEQSARYERLNGFLRHLMEGTEQAASAILSRAESAAEEHRAQVWRTNEVWRHQVGRRLTLLAALMTILMALQAWGLVLWKSTGAASPPTRTELTHAEQRPPLARRAPAAFPR
jgi:hypothetical protein